MSTHTTDSLPNMHAAASRARLANKKASLFSSGTVQKLNSSGEEGREGVLGCGPADRAHMARRARMSQQRVSLKIALHGMRRLTRLVDAVGVGDVGQKASDRFPQEGVAGGVIDAASRCGTGDSNQWAGGGGRQS